MLRRNKDKQSEDKDQKKLSTKQYEDLGRIVASIYETGYLDKNKTYKMSFIKGMVGGLGGVIGATIVVALLIWLLSLLSSVPLVGRFFDSVEQTVNSTTN